MRKSSLFSILLPLLLSIFLVRSVQAETNTQIIKIGELVNGVITDEVARQVYQIHLDKPGLLTIDFTAYFGSVKFELMDQNNSIVFGDVFYDGDENNPQKGWYSEYLEAGNYNFIVYKKRYGSSNTGKFTFKTSFEPTKNNEVEPNNGTVPAQPLPLGKEVIGLISWNDHSDTFKLTLDEPGLLTVNTTTYFDNVKINLEDESGKTVFYDKIYYGTVNNPRKENYSEYLEAGTYYFTIQQADFSEDTGTYTLSTLFEPTKNTEKEFNNGRVPAEVLSLNYLVKGLISWNDNLDTYKFSLDQQTTIDIITTAYFDNVVVILEDKDGKMIDKMYFYDGNVNMPQIKTLEYTLKPGMYYIHVGRKSEYGNNGTYTLRISNTVNLIDVPTDAFYYDAVMKLTGAGIISGYPDSTFRPNQPLIREHAVLLLKRALNLQVPDNYENIADQFTDVGRNHPYAKEIAAVYHAGIFNGYNNRMGLNDELTREQMASVLVRAFQLKGYSYKDSLTTVKDADKILPVHKNDVDILYDLSITKGKGNGYFAPKDSITRGEFVTFLDRAMKK
ncbi:S-layer homology domain-containing protein [Caldifermentibacillus hisashii]|uniref:S-layer homology domain-containing protein n=1 Tax=Caldifermentibacillus hisashii TaxID=996558 RepID=UPI0031FD5D45|nr:S-layer homology domain-containing protein [Caldibacillus thermoamylovorans]